MQHSFKKTPLNSNREILDNVKEIKKDTFLVTAEVHCSLDDGASKEKSNSVESVAQDIQPTVVLMDIFKSKVAIDYLKENEHLIKEISKKSVEIIVNDEENQPGMVNQPISEMKHLNEQSSTETKKVADKLNLCHIKENSLNKKMRRPEE
ncbi:hypothetical protein CEXT_388211 [Caerostris extrusa]|uniref:Uncharacterized protein n=1 Tax=Caerostris extrusa TaxID=172846 RepID=A0AAV4VKK3_CAEEX|nr:hypothetical protein CEXT_388211 [Caerostris extrusa]